MLRLRPSGIKRLDLVGVPFSPCGGGMRCRRVRGRAGPGAAAPRALRPAHRAGGGSPGLRPQPLPRRALPPLLRPLHHTRCGCAQWHHAARRELMTPSEFHIVRTRGHGKQYIYNFCNTTFVWVRVNRSCVPILSQTPSSCQTSAVGTHPPPRRYHNMLATEDFCGVHTGAPVGGCVACARAECSGVVMGRTPVRCCVEDACPTCRSSSLKINLKQCHS